MTLPSFFSSRTEDVELDDEFIAGKANSYMDDVEKIKHGFGMGGSKHQKHNLPGSGRNEASRHLGALVMGQSSRSSILGCLDGVSPPGSPQTISRSMDFENGLIKTAPAAFGQGLSSTSLTLSGSSSSFTRTGRPDPTPLQTALRKKGVTPPHLGSFEQFKLGNFVKKQEKLDILEFPKTLTVDFTKMLLEAQSPMKKENTAASGDEDGEVSSSICHFAIAFPVNMLNIVCPYLS